jgi:hypothetical protein
MIDSRCLAKLIVTCLGLSCGLTAIASQIVREKYIVFDNTEEAFAWLKKEHPARAEKAIPSDDPAYHHDALKYLGIPTHVRMDSIAKHFPEAIGSIESRGHDMTVVRQ